MFIKKFLSEAKEIINQLDEKSIDTAVDLLVKLREKSGRLFILGVGGSAANASHAVNDFRKIVGIEAYAPTDNVAELTARTNDEGWSSTFANWLAISRLSFKDMLLILSVGGGNVTENISPNLVAALHYGQKRGAKIVGIVGRDGGYTAQVADICIRIPVVNIQHVTPHTEAFQAVIWHLLVSHPKLKMVETTWELLNGATKQFAETE
jgi:D-sedoheptulose 7-phosphate isomerase